MGVHDRPYMQDDEPPMGGRGLTFGLPRPGQVVKYLVVLNVGMFLVQAFVDRPTWRYPAGMLSQTLGVTVGGFWQIWRYFTFQFLHANIWHILLNMLGLYLLGTPLERHFGSRWFLKFYLTCGVAAGLAYVLLGSLLRIPPGHPIIGASGGVYGILLAAAVFFPSFQIIFLFFPVPIRLAAIIIFGLMIVVVLQGLGGAVSGDALSDAAHLGGAAMAALWIFAAPVLRRVRESVGTRSSGAWERKMKRRAAEQAEIDRVLQKIHDHGLASLTRKEKDLLRDATARQRQEERGSY